MEKLREDYRALKEETDTALQNERQTVSLLVAEKAHLASELQRLDGFESSMCASRARNVYLFLPGRGTGIG